MTHEPECAVHGDRLRPMPCICTAIRAAYQRGVAYEQEKHEMIIANAWNAGYQQGQQDERGKAEQIHRMECNELRWMIGMARDDTWNVALDAAREAVERRWETDPDAASDWLVIALREIHSLRLDNSRQHLNKMVTDKLDLYDRQDVYFNQHGKGENP